MSPHTPGPWRVTVDEARPDCVLVDVVDPAGVTVCEFTNGDLARDTANARLIAAAPDLLEALKDAVALIRTWHGMGESASYSDAMWALYQQSPEMQRLNAVIANAAGDP